MTDQILNQNVVVDDPWASAENPVFRAAEYWGQIHMDVWYCVLEKGQGKIQFDPATHSVDARRTAVEMILSPLPELNIQFEVSRSLIVESADYAKIVLPSIKQFGLSPREMNGKWVKLHFKGTGRKYTNNQGEERENTTFEFLKVFDSEDSCRADYNWESGTTGNTGNSVSNAAPEDKAKATAFQFLKAIVNEACKTEKDVAKVRDVVAGKIVAMPMISAHYTVDSAETVELIAEAIGK